MVGGGSHFRYTVGTVVNLGFRRRPQRRGQERCCWRLLSGDLEPSPPHRTGCNKRRRRRREGVLQSGASEVSESPLPLLPSRMASERRRACEFVTARCTSPCTPAPISKLSSPLPDATVVGTGGLLNASCLWNALCSPMATRL